MKELGEAIADAYRVAVLVSQALPHFTMAGYGGEAHLGLGWDLPLEYGTGPLVHTLTPSFDWYPGAGTVAGRFTYSPVALPLAEGGVLLYPSGGWFVDGEGSGPRAELAMFLGMAERSRDNEGHRRIIGLELRGGYDHGLGRANDGWDLRLSFVMPLHVELFVGQLL
jgi:hypothetical protein